MKYSTLCRVLDTSGGLRKGPKKKIEKKEGKGKGERCLLERFSFFIFIFISILMSGQFSFPAQLNGDFITGLIDLPSHLTN